MNFYLRIVTKMKPTRTIFETSHYRVAINFNLYCQQLEGLRQEIERNRPELTNRKGAVFHHDNARPHTLLATRQK